jgi:hypothetical protein
MLRFPRAVAQTTAECGAARASHVRSHGHACYSRACCSGRLLSVLLLLARALLVAFVRGSPVF